MRKPILWSEKIAANTQRVLTFWREQMETQRFIPSPPTNQQKRATQPKDSPNG